MRFYDGTPGTRHVNTNTIVTLASDGERAETRTTFTVFQCLPDFPLQAIVVGRYLDRFELGAHGWQFEEREIAMGLIGDVSRHLAALPSPASRRALIASPTWRWTPAAASVPWRLRSPVAG